MATSTIERVRMLHEDVEIFEKAVAEELVARATMKSRPDQIMSDHTTHALLGQITARRAQLVALYEDADGSLREDVDEMTGEGAIDAFYERLARAREAHAGSEPVPVAADAEEQMLAAVLEAEPAVAFSGEEGDGRFVDLHGCHEAFVNLRGIKPRVAPGAGTTGKAGKSGAATSAVDYYTYLVEYALSPERVPLEAARGGGYARYLQQLLDALCDFVRRTHPLLDLPALLAEAEADFRRRWDGREVGRWQGGDAAAAPAAAPAAEGAQGEGAMDLSSLRSAEEVEEKLGPERIKRELAQRGLKCGGRPSERASRLLLALTAPEKLDRKQYAPQHARIGGGANGDANRHAGTDGAGAADAAGAAGAAGAHGRRCAALEAAVQRLGAVLGKTVEQTAANVEKNASRTFDEIAADLAAAEEAADGDSGARDADDMPDDDDEAPVYNPKNLPLGWDGKPIPYWLYKLHGLNLEFKCEICGGVSYWGPREFERHFQEARHAHSMRCLGIANSKAYHGVTLIEDAYAMQARLAEEERRKQFVAELDEEYEDSMGNVMPKKTYEDLARQGLL